MKTAKSIVTTALFSFFAVAMAGCAPSSSPSATSSVDAPAETAAITIGKLCGGKVCSKYQVCCNSAHGDYCTTAACDESVSEQAPTVVEAAIGQTCGKMICSRYQSCCPTVHGPECTTKACDE